MTPTEMVELKPGMLVRVRGCLGRSPAHFVRTTWDPRYVLVRFGTVRAGYRQLLTVVPAADLLPYRRRKG